ncbi:MAG TPA: DNA starvation/stationary phase protection protein [Phototrophicaceae bacterium]|nr:DNA starvation/stationary phase protection protein [Phototrophicaceae bacterium]
MATKTNTAVKLELGLDEKSVADVVSILRVLLADEFVLYTKLRNYHWNVTGPNFRELHLLFEEQYDELAEIIDETAERIRQYGETAPGTLEEFKELTRLTEEPGVSPGWQTMVGNACADHEALVRFLREDIERIDDEADDVGVEDLLTGYLQQHQKMAWLLRAHLENA